MTKKQLQAINRMAETTKKITLDSAGEQQIVAPKTGETLGYLVTGPYFFLYYHAPIEGVDHKTPYKENNLGIWDRFQKPTGAMSNMDSHSTLVRSPFDCMELDSVFYPLRASQMHLSIKEAAKKVGSQRVVALSGVDERKDETRTITGYYNTSYVRMAIDAMGCAPWCYLVYSDGSQEIPVLYMYSDADKFEQSEFCAIVLPIRLNFLKKGV